MKTTFIIHLLLFTTFVSEGTKQSFGPANYILVFNESPKLHENVNDFQKQYFEMVNLFAWGFDVASNEQVHFWVMCTENAADVMFVPLIRENDAQLAKCFQAGDEAKGVYSLHTIMIEFIPEAYADSQWKPNENITIVLSDGDLTEEETTLPNSADHLRSINNMFFFYVRTTKSVDDLEIEKMEKLTKSENRERSQVIQFDSDDRSGTWDKFLTALCHPDVMTEVRKKTCNYTMYIPTSSTTKKPNSEKENEKTGESGKDPGNDNVVMIGAICGCVVVVLLIVMVVVVVVFRRRNAKKVAKKDARLQKGKATSEIQRAEKGRAVVADLNETTRKSIMPKSVAENRSKSVAKQRAKSVKGATSTTGMTSTKSGPGGQSVKSLNPASKKFVVSQSKLKSVASQSKLKSVASQSKLKSVASQSKSKSVAPQKNLSKSIAKQMKAKK